MFDSKRPLKIGVLAGIVVVIVVVVALATGGGGSPIDAAMAFYRAGNEGNYDKAFSYLMREVQLGWKMAGAIFPRFDNAMDGATRRGNIARIESTHAAEYAPGIATVWLAIYYRDGDQAEDVLTLMRVDGRWRINKSLLLITPSP